MGTAALGCCWNIGNSQFEIHVGTDLVSGCDLWMEICDVYSDTELLLERRLVPACRPRLGRPGHELLQTVCMFGVLVNVAYLTSTLQALFLWQVLVHRRDDVHRFGGTRVPGNAEEHTRVVDEVDGKSVGFNGTLAHWACHRQAQLGLILSTWLSALA